jgi:uncharacterized membrane protein YjfL (UPF0719 family)
MFLTRVAVSVFEFFLSVVLSVLVVYVTYRIFLLANKDYDGEEEIKAGNVSVAILQAAILIGASLIIHKGMDPVVSLMQLYLTTPLRETVSDWHFPLLAFAHLFMAFVIAVLSISFALRFFGKLTTKVNEGEELKRGNVAVGVMLAAVVIVVSLYISDGVSSLSKALLPQPSIGRIQIQD